MDGPEPPECSQCGKEITDEPDISCQVCMATLCSNPDCLSEHNKENHPNLPLYMYEGDGKGGGTIRRLDDPIKIAVTRAFASRTASHPFLVNSPSGASVNSKWLYWS